MLDIVIPNSVKSIGDGAFGGCSRMSSIVIPNSVSEISGMAFELVPNIIYSGIATGAPWGAKSLNGYVDGNYVYKDNTKTILLACNASVSGSIVIPTSVEIIENHAFSWCDEITDVVISNGVISIGSGAFSHCDRLRTIIIPNTVVNIGGMAFYECPNLKSITIPSSVMNVGRLAFSECKKLQEFRYPLGLNISEAGLPKATRTISYKQNNTFSQQSGTVIRMEKDGGVYKIPCKINGAKLKMIFDSGASNVCLSETTAEYLLENDYITIDDFIGVGSSSIADGRIVDHLKINLRDVEIEGMHLRNITGIVIVGQKGSLLLGQSAIQALGPVTIDGDQLIIHNGSQQLTDNEIESIRKQAEGGMDEHDWYFVISQYQKLDKYGVADYYDLSNLVFALQQTDQFDKSGKVLERWFESYAQYSTPQVLYDMYDSYAMYYRYKDTPNYNKAIDCLNQMKSILNKLYREGTAKYEHKNYLISKALGSCFFNMKDYATSYIYYKKARISYMLANNLSVDKLEEKGFRDKKLAYCEYMMAVCTGTDNPDLSRGLMKDAARLGDEDAQAFCESLGISYR